MRKVFQLVKFTGADILEKEDFFIEILNGPIVVVSSGTSTGALRILDSIELGQNILKMIKNGKKSREKTKAGSKVQKKTKVVQSGRKRSVGKKIKKS